MTGDVPASATRYAAFVDAMLAEHGVTLGARRGFGESGLWTAGRLFAFLGHGRLVVKLPRTRVDELVAAGEGERFDPGHGRRMREWLSLDPASRLDWASLAHEACAFVAAARTER